MSVLADYFGEPNENGFAERNKLGAFNDMDR